MKVAIISEVENTTVSCLNNTSQTNYLRKLLEENNIEFTYKIKDADYIIYASCAFCGESIDNFEKTLEELLICQNYYKYNLIIAGCITKLYKFEDENDRVKVINNSIWSREIVNYLLNENKKATINDKIESSITSYSPKDITFSINIENGCINNCSFCKENYMHNKIESLPYDELLEYLKNKIKNGTRSIDFHGECLNLYGVDLTKEKILHKLLHELGKEKDLINISIAEITIQNMYDELLKEIIHNDKIGCVSLQLESASDRILKSMNRNHTLKDYQEIASEIQKSGKFVDTVLMAGYPTETYEDLDKTIEFINQNNISITDIAEYDDFELLPSHKLKQFSKQEKRRHFNYLKNALIPIKHRIYENNINKMSHAVVHDKIDNIIMTSSRTPIFAYTTKKEYQNLEIGDIIEEPPKKYIKSSKLFYGHHIYKY